MVRSTIGIGNRKKNKKQITPEAHLYYLTVISSSRSVLLFIAFCSCAFVSAEGSTQQEQPAEQTYSACWKRMDRKTCYSHHNINAVPRF